MKQLIIKDRFLHADEDGSQIVVLLPPVFSVKAYYHSDDKTLGLSFYDDRKGDWHDSLIYDPIISVGETIIDFFEFIKSDKEKLRIVTKAVEELFITDVASFISEDQTPGGQYADAPYFDFALFENHVKQFMEEHLDNVKQAKPKK